MGDFDDLKAEVYSANQELDQRGLVTYTFGNVSGVDRARGVFAIKPSGVPYSELFPEMMVVLDFECHTVEGTLRASSDAPTHAELYREFTDIGGIVHTHSTHATAWAQALRPLPCLGTTHADHLPGPVPCTPLLADAQIQGDYERETGRMIVETLQNFNPAHVPMVLVGGHGPFCWGNTPDMAVYNAVVLEELARMAYMTLTLNPDITPLPDSLIERHFHRKHGPDAYYGQTR